MNLLSSVVEALSEGATLAVVFLAVEVLAAPEGTPFNWATNPVVAWWPAAAGWLNALPPTALFISLLALAVLLQGLQSLGRFANNVSVGYFAAECRAGVTARIHSQGPEAIRNQIEQSGQLLVLLLMGGALSDWGEPGLAPP
ncbi:MAG: hypothetical protein KFB97_04680 [Cyanobium sp. M30B3]|nr:MAG: hypothetical protein KFB97_04680 [Cyanobium sp. M30B3]